MKISRVRPYLVALLVLILMGFAGPAGAETYRASDYPGSGAAVTPLNAAYQLFDAAFTNGDLATTSDLVADDAIIRTDRGILVDPQGLLDSMEALVGPELVDVEVVGDMAILRWEADLGGSTYRGRTIAIFDNGEFTRVTMLNESVTSSDTEVAVPEVATGIYPAAPGVGITASSAAPDVEVGIYPAAAGVDY